MRGFFIVFSIIIPALAMSAAAQGISKLPNYQSWKLYGAVVCEDGSLAKVFQKDGNFLQTIHVSSGNIYFEYLSAHPPEHMYFKKIASGKSLQILRRKEYVQFLKVEAPDFLDWLFGRESSCTHKSS